MAKKTNINPMGDRVLVRPAVAEDKTSSGIILPESAQEKPMHGEVIAVGPGSLNDSDERTPVEVSKGAKVIYGTYSGSKIEVDGEELVILKETELLAVLED